MQEFRPPGHTVEVEFALPEKTGEWAGPCPPAYLPPWGAVISHFWKAPPFAQWP